MLQSLSIRNVAIIDQTKIEFGVGLNIISGETGAGKSIIIDSVSLLLGARGSSDWVRTGFQEAVIEGLFDLKYLPWMKTRLTELGFSLDANSPDDFVIKRVLNLSGKSRIFVNGEICSLGVLQKLCHGLIDICSQHEYQSLLKSSVQLQILDRFGETVPLADEVRSLLQEKNRLRELIDAWRFSEAERSREGDFLKFQIHEIESAHLFEEEEEHLRLKKDLVQSSKTRTDLAQAIFQTLNVQNESLASPHSPLESLRIALQKAKNLTHLDPSFEEAFTLLENAAVATEEGLSRVEKYLEQITIDPDELESVQERLNLISHLKRKYGQSYSLIFESLDGFKKRLEKIEPQDFDLERSQRTLLELSAELKKKSDHLLKARKRSAQNLGELITNELKDLNMKEAAIKIEVIQIERGVMEVAFLVRANLGQEFSPIEKTASGGELSRILLSIRRITSGHLKSDESAGLGIYLFDEVDSGIGGQTAFQVGKKLKAVSQGHQVLCITHLPQVAAFADLHFVVKKETRSNRTIASVQTLVKKERKTELARMLGGPSLSRKSIENAAELLSLAV